MNKLSYYIGKAGEVVGEPERDPLKDLYPSFVSVAKASASISCRHTLVPLFPHLYSLMAFWFFDSSLLLFWFLSSDSLRIWFSSPFCSYPSHLVFNVSFNQGSFHFYIGLALFSFFIERLFKNPHWCYLHLSLLLLTTKLYISGSDDNKTSRSKFTSSALNH